MAELGPEHDPHGITDEELDDLLDRAGATSDHALLRRLLRTTLQIAEDAPDRLDLKITAAVVDEMHTAFRTFAPYRDKRKVTIFGSARTRPEDPLYDQAREVANRMAEHDWMVVTGAGPGIMAAGLQGAGRDRAFGVTIRLPFEEAVNRFIEGDDKLVSMKYFFTRKLMLVKESSAFVALPGGFGTQDETFELFTLQQTGKGHPAPVVLLDTPGGTYWQRWADFVRDELAANGLIAPDDQQLYLVTDDVDEAAEEITGFYRNYHSIRWVGERLVLRLRHEPTHDEVTMLNDRFSELCRAGHISRTEPLGAERRGEDELELPRLVMRYDQTKMSRLRDLIAAVNELDSALAAG